jgi:hypothetical protein
MSAADKERCGRLIEDLENDYVKGNNNYPSMITDAYSISINYRQSIPASRVFNDLEVVVFANIEIDKDGEKVSKDKSHIRCYNCGIKWHYLNKCPLSKKINEAVADKVETTDATANMTTKQFLITTKEYEAYDEFAFHQSNHQVNRNWILLYNCSIEDIYVMESCWQTSGSPRII